MLGAWNVAAGREQLGQQEPLGGCVGQGPVPRRGPWYSRHRLREVGDGAHGIAGE